MRSILPAVLVSILLAAPPVSRAEPARRALLIGIDLYKSAPKPGASPSAGSGPASQDSMSGGKDSMTSAPSPAPSAADSMSTPAPKSRGIWINLDGAVNDVQAFREILVGRYGFARGDIRLLENKEATHANILAAVREHLIAPTKPGDLCVLVYAGHGSQVINSKSKEADGKDETLVPADSEKGAPDIRDKELRDLFNGILDRGGVLTAIFDSCHSGSVARGLPRELKSRHLPPDPRDAKDASEPGASPEERGALVLSAAQDEQTAGEAVDGHGQPHGAFSLNLLKVLATAPVNESAEQVMRRVKAMMQAEGRSQEPVLAGKKRKDGPLFGAGAGELAGRTTVAVLKFWSEKDIELQGGRAIGLTPGCELVRVRGTGKDEPVRLRVVSADGMARSKAMRLSGGAVASGDLFALDRWAPDPDALRVHLPPSVPDASLAEATAQLPALTPAGPVKFVDDPVRETPTHVLAWTAEGWRLTPAAGAPVTLPRPLSRDALTAALGAGPASVFVSLPPGEKLAAQLSSSGPAGASFTVTDRASDGVYGLVGRWVGGKLAYSWVMPGRTEAGEGVNPMPARSDWLDCPSDKDVAGVALALRDLAGRLARLRAWLVLSTPPDNGEFPYRLALKDAATGKINDAGTMVDGESYGLVMVAPPEKLKGRVEKRYVYIFTIDSFGKGTLLFPRADAGNVENRLPFAAADGGDGPELRLGKPDLIQVGAPYGVDTLVCVTTAEAIPDPDVFQFEGARSRGQAANPLGTLLAGVGSHSRGAADPTPVNWSIQRFSVRSTPGPR